MSGPGSASAGAPAGRPVVRRSAAEAIAEVADHGSWREWPEVPAPGDEPGPGAPASDYAVELAAARAATGCSEAVVVGQATVGGVPAAVLAWEFGFLGGSIGVRTAARIVAAIRRATGEGLPLLALPRSGGTRMQEGTPAFVQMTAITAALAEHRRAALPYLVHLCHPTTGGVLATLGSAGDLTTAEPGALVGFLGPRAVAAITGRPLTPGVQSAENLVAHGIVDDVLAWPALRARWVTALTLWAARPAPADTPALADTPARAGGGDRPEGSTPGPPTRASQARTGAGDPPAASDADPPLGLAARAARRGDASLGRAVADAPRDEQQLWALVVDSRSPQRAGAAAWLEAHVADRILLTGTNAGERGSGVRVGLGRVRSLPVVFAATVDRTEGEPLTVAGLRVVRRAVALAGRWRLPVLAVVDTLGAQLSDAAETGGIAGEISRTMLDLVDCPTPTVALLLGPGTGGAALALLAADRVLATSDSWVAPLPPEGAAAIRHHGSHDPGALAWDQQVGAHALARMGFVDALVPGAPDPSAPADPDAGWLGLAAEAVVAALREACTARDPALRTSRFAAWQDGPG
jgi:acyl-CoA carboxylase subunit beta